MHGRRSKLIFGLFLASAAVVLVLALSSGFALNSLLDSLEQSRHERLLAEAQSASLVVSATELENIQQVGDLASNEAVSLKSRLSAFASLHQLTEISFIRQLPSGQLQYIISSNQGESAHDIASPTFAADALLEAAFSGSVEVIDISKPGSEIYPDNNLTAFSPVYNSNGRVIAIAAVGIDETLVNGTVSNIRNLMIVLVVCIIVVVATACINMFLQIREEKELAQGLQLQKEMLEQARQLSLEREQALNHAVRASEVKSEFLSNISHEMRTPMNAIIGMTTIALASKDGERKDFCLERIEDASENLLGIITDFLDMTNIQADELVLDNAAFDLRKTVASCVGEYSFKIHDKNLKLDVSIDEDIPQMLLGDGPRLSKIIDKLLSNAVKFTDQDGLINLRIRQLSQGAQGQELLFEVEDNGIGISLADAENLFGSFEQLDRSLTRSYGGTGLGLAIARHLVELMGGQIGVESELGAGSRFYFTLSLAEAAL